MRRALMILALSLICGSVAAQTVVRGARVDALETECLSNSYAPCRGVGDSHVRVRAARRAVTVRVVSVEARSAAHPGTPWRRTTGPFHLLVGGQRAAGSVRVSRRSAQQIQVFFDVLPVADSAVVRTTLEVDGQRVTVEADHTVWHESPDPDF